MLGCNQSLPVRFLEDTELAKLIAILNVIAWAGFWAFGYLALTASDGTGGEAEGTVSVCVPHGEGRGTDDCIDDGQEYDVGGTGELP